MLSWMESNKDILFSGLGTGLVLFLISKLLASKRDASQTQKSGKNSKNIQAGGNVTIEKSRKE